MKKYMPPLLLAGKILVERMLEKGVVLTAGITKRDGKFHHKLDVETWDDHTKHQAQFAHKDQIKEL